MTSRVTARLVTPNPALAVVVMSTVAVIGVPSMVADTVLVSATVEASVPVVTPFTSVAAMGPSVLPEPVADSTTVAPLMTLLLASRAVTVIVLVSRPSPRMVVGVALMVELAALTAPGVTVTVAVCVMVTASMVAETVFASATVDSTVPVATPSDGDQLADYQCVLREQISFFEATSEDASGSSQGRNRPMKIGQVGIECKQ